MSYIPRAAERKFLRMSGFFKAVLVTGARQVGKTTMLRHLAAGSSRSYVSMDDADERELARSDPKLFFQVHKPPLLIDEVQRAPELFEPIKVICDQSEETGLFWLTGSEHYEMMRNVRESLAGRVGIMHLYGLSAREKRGDTSTPPFACDYASLVEAAGHSTPMDIHAVFADIWQGGMPAVQHADQDMRRAYLSSYADTYLLRDAVREGGIKDEGKFLRFLKACAALTGEMVSYTTLAEAAGITAPTAKEWLYLLAGMGIIYLLPPFANNAMKRLVRMPKLYFCDTGLCANLSMWLTEETLQVGAASGHYFENYVVMELVKRFSYASSNARLSYYRDSNKKEIDLVVEEDGLLHPLEIKKGASPSKQEVNKFSVLDKATLQRSSGGIVCLADKPMPIDKQNSYIPCWLL